MCVEGGLSLASSPSGHVSAAGGTEGGIEGGRASSGCCQKQLCKQGPNELFGITLPAGQPFQLPSFVFETLKQLHKKEN